METREHGRYLYLLTDSDSAMNRKRENAWAINSESRICLTIHRITGKKMPPVHVHPAPYCSRSGWLSRRRLRGDEGDDLAASDVAVPDDDSLSAVFARLPDAADVVRCAATCRRWCRVVAKDAALLSSRVQLPPLPRLALGFFHQEIAGATTRKRKRSAPAPPSFVPTAAAARLLGSSLQNHNPLSLADAIVPDHGADDDGRLLVSSLLDGARPIAARNGWLVLELRRERYTDALKLCVCNPMTGDMAPLPPPPLETKKNPGVYACALLTGHDLDEKQNPGGSFFRLLLVYNRGSFTALRSYSSDTNRWSTEAKRSGPKMAAETLRRLGQSVVIRGVAYWHLRLTVFAVRLDVPQPAELPLPSCYCHWITDRLPGRRAIAVVPDYDDDGEKKRLMFISACFAGDCIALIKTVFCASDSGDDDDGIWKRKEMIELTQLKVGHYDKWKNIPRKEFIHLRWFCERTGVLIFTLGQGTESPGTFALNLATHKLEKLADGLDCHSWENFVGYEYEMDGAEYLASISPPQIAN